MHSKKANEARPNKAEKATSPFAFLPDAEQSVPHGFYEKETMVW